MIYIITYRHLFGIRLFQSTLGMSEMTETFENETAETVELLLGAYLLDMLQCLWQ